VIETTVPEINITELMERVRAESQRPKPHRRTAPSADGAAVLPPVAMLPGAPAVWIPGPVKSKKERLDALVQTARDKNEPGSRIPKFLRRFFRKQGGYNRAVVESIAALSSTTDDLTRRLGEITTCLGQFNSWLLALHEQSDADANWMKSAAPGVSRIAEYESELRQTQGELESVRATLKLLSADQPKRQEIERKVAALEAHRAALLERITEAETQFHDHFAALEKHSDVTNTELRGRTERLGKELERVSGQNEAFRAFESEFTQAAQQTGDHLRNLQAQTDHAGGHLRILQAQTDRLGVHVNNLQGYVDTQVIEASAIRHSFDQRVDDMANETAFIKGELSEFGSLLQRLLANSSKAPLGQKKSGAKGSALGLDAFYFSFENRFRGARDEIKARVAFYLPFLRKTGAVTSRSPVLDLGCGRGEWLELLKEHELEGRGVDLNTAMVAQCKARGLKVRLGDALEHLQSLRANSQDAVTGFHIIEHLPFETLMALLGEVRRVLKPGGVAIFESPNCKNLVVGACNFNIDPTHRNPVYPETAEFMLASHGFENIRIEYLSPVPNPKFEGATPDLAIIKDFFYGPQDFGIIAYKPTKR
jgi:SAM-dependent methyltransferase